MSASLPMPEGMTETKLTRDEIKRDVVWKCFYKGTSYRIVEGLLINDLQRRASTGYYVHWQYTPSVAHAISQIIQQTTGTRI